MKPQILLSSILALVCATQPVAAQQTDTPPRQVNESAGIRWLQQNAIPLRHITAGNGFADLAPLKQILQGVKVVGLGEATHGTREFFQIKHRLLEFLVTEMGFNAFAIESSSAGSQRINDYVLHGKGDLAAALTGQGYVAWDTEEFTEIVKWLRAYNQRVPDGKKVRFYGVDIWNNGIGREATLAYLRKVAPERVAITDSLFRNLAREEVRWPNRIDSAAQRRMLPLLPPLQDAIDHLGTNKQTLVSRSSLAEFDDALRHVEVMKQWLMSNTSALLPPFVGGWVRSVYMAENVIYLADRMGPEARFVVWAFNSHISRQYGDGVINMGDRLGRKYGDGYYAFGLEFGRGAFQYRAWLAGGVLGNLREGVFPPAPAKSFPWYLNRVKLGDLILDLRKARSKPEVLAWLQSPLTTHDAGWSFSPERQDFLSQASFASRYDGIVFIDETTRTRPTPNALKNTSAPGGISWTF